MTFNPDIHHRRSIRLKEYDYSSAGAYFITACTRHREHLFGRIEQGVMITNEAGDAVLRSWIDLLSHYDEITLDAFVIMPNHIHGIVIITHAGAPVGAIHELPLHELPQQELPLPPTRRQMIIPKITGRFKMVSAKEINLLRQRPGVPVWQRNYWEHVIRNEEELSRIRHYIEHNPNQWEEDKLNGGSGNRVLDAQGEYGEDAWRV